MDREPTYGATFVRHLAKLGRQTPYRYEDLQLVKAMSQTEMADWIHVTDARSGAERLWQAPDFPMPQPFGAG
jgi:hypothetical protein